MDFIEEWFHISPDGGNGSLELLYIAVILAIIVIIVFRSYFIGLFSRYLGRRRRP